MHFIRPVQRIAKKLKHQNEQQREAFVALGQQILKAKSATKNNDIVCNNERRMSKRHYLRN